MAMDERGLGKQLQVARQAAGLTQQALCQRANLSFSTLTKIERGAIKSPSIFTILAIAGALDMGLDDLMGNSRYSPALANRTLRTTQGGATFIYFDLNGCLVRYYQRAFAQIASATNNSVDVVEMTFLQYNDAVCRGTMSFSDFDEALARRLGVTDISWSAYYLAAAEGVAVMHELLTWAASNYRVGLLTNTMPGLLPGLRKLGKIPNLAYDAIIDSSEVGTVKPEASIYALAATEAGVPAHEILLIDDTPGNLVAAQKHGWQALWFDVALAEESTAAIRTAIEPAA